MTSTTDIAGSSMIAWPPPSPSSPAPAAHRYAASGLDRSMRPSNLADRSADASVSMYKNGNQPSQKPISRLIEVPVEIP